MGQPHLLNARNPTTTKETFVVVLSTMWASANWCLSKYKKVVQEEMKGCQTTSHRESHREEGLLFYPSLCLLPEPAHMLAISLASAFMLGYPFEKTGFLWRNLMITNSPCCVFPPMRSSPIALSPHHPSLHPPFTSLPQCLCWALLIRYLFPVVSQDKNMENDPEKEQNISLFMLCFTEN